MGTCSSTTTMPTRNTQPTLPTHGPATSYLQAKHDPEDIHRRRTAPQRSITPRTHIPTRHPHRLIGPARSVLRFHARTLTPTLLHLRTYTHALTSSNQPTHIPTPSRPNTIPPYPHHPLTRPGPMHRRGKISRRPR